MKRWIKSLKENDMFAWGDLIIIGSLIFLSFLPVIIFTHNKTNTTPTEVTSGATENTTSTAVYAVVSNNGREVKRFNLTKITKDTIYHYKDKNGNSNIIEIKNHKVHIKEANCNDQVCVRQGFKNKPGETIVCLPHKLLIEIKSADGKNENGGMVN